MGMRTSLRTSKIITFALLLVGLWVVVAVVDLAGIVNEAFAAGTSVGQAPLSGLLGLLVLAVVLGLAVVLYGELSEPGAPPSTWPPE